MKIKLERPYEPVVDEFFRHNPSLGHKLTRSDKEIVLEIEADGLPEEARRQIWRHFKYLPLFNWAGAELDDVVFWERPRLFDEIVSDFVTLIADLVFTWVAALEARGFLLAGILGQGLGLPIYTVRKDKPFYRRFPGWRVPFTNWKGKEETLFLFEKEYLAGAKVLVVDDLIETGNSLAATIKGLEGLGATVVGAFYLCDLLTDERRADFSIPIRAFVLPAKRFDAAGSDRVA